MSDMKQIALNAIRYRDQQGNLGTMTKQDRRWLIRYIDQRQSEYEELERAVEAISRAFKDGYYLLSDRAIEQMVNEDSEYAPMMRARAALARLRGDA